MRDCSPLYKRRTGWLFPWSRFGSRFVSRAALLWVLAGAVLIPNCLAQGVIEGQVRVSAETTVPPPSGRYQIKASAPVAPPDLAAAVVYLEGAFPAGTNSAGVVRMEQRHFQFKPAVLPVRKGTLVEFPNLDDDYHNVFSYSKVKRFDLGRYKKEEKPPAQKFDKPGIVKLFCEIHEHMRGTILVLDTPYFQKTGEDGKFQLTNIPPGKYTLKAWIDESTTLQKPVEVKDGETVKVDFAEK